MRRYERFSTLLTSNRPVEDWGKLLAMSRPSAPCSIASSTTAMCSVPGPAVGPKDHPILTESEKKKRRKAWFNNGDSVPIPWNLSLSRQRWPNRGRPEPPPPFRPLVGAPVAFLRSRYPPPRCSEYNPLCCLRKKVCKTASTRYNYRCPGSAPLAGFGVTTHGRCSR